MSLDRKSTTVKNILKAIKDNLVSVTYAVQESKETDEVTDISPEKFITGLEFYGESGIFSDSIDFKYETHKKDNYISLHIGNLSTFCNVSIVAKLQINDGVNIENVEKELRKTIFDEVADKIST